MTNQHEKKKMTTKETFKLFSMAALALMVTSCSVDDNPTQQPEEPTVTIGGTVYPDGITESPYTYQP